MGAFINRQEASKLCVFRDLWFLMDCAKMLILFVLLAEELFSSLVFQNKLVTILQTQTDCTKDR